MGMVEEHENRVSVQSDAEPAKPVAASTEPAASEQDEQSATTMQGLMSEVRHEFRTPRRGEVVDGVVVSVDRDGVLVDIGTKSEGLIPGHESQPFVERGELNLGDDVLVYVVQPENQDGHVVLSLNRARSERGWRTMQKQFEEGKIVEAEVVDYNKGGLIASVDDVRGFVPMSQVAGVRIEGASEEELKEKLGALIGQKMFVKVLEINRRRNRLILSERQATQERRGVRKEQLITELQEGETRHGRVSSICDFGAFVDLGGADGLIHLSELAWRQVSHPSEVLKVGDEVDVYILNVDREKKKIALSLRRLQPEPWTTMADRYQAGDLVQGTVTKLATFGAFARVEDGIEGLIHISELGDQHITHPREVVKEGDVLTLRVLRVDPARRRLGLSLKQVDNPQADNPDVENPSVPAE
jgi:small subunit ribosomal protein S1